MSAPALALLLLAFPSAASAAGRVLSVKGGPLTAEGRTFKAGDELPNAEVKLATGTATIAMDGARFLLTGPARLTPRKSYFSLELGSLLSVLKHGSRRFSVRTPTAVAAVRGTDFYVGVGPRKEVDVCICNGELDVASTHSIREDEMKLQHWPMAAEHHLNYRFWMVKSETIRGASPMRGHTDAELDALRKLLAEEKP